MKPTKNQRSLLKFYARHRTAPPTLSSVLPSFVLPWTIMALLNAVASAWFLWSGLPVIAGGPEPAGPDRDRGRPGRPPHRPHRHPRGVVELS
jgi:hypothetical protein